MTTINLSSEEIKNNIVEFNNAEREEEEARSIELGFNDRTDSFLLWEDSELIATFKTFKGLMGRALPKIALNDLKKVA